MSSVDERAAIRSVIERKQQQIEIYKNDLKAKEQDKSFSDEVYRQKIADLESDIKHLEKRLSGGKVA
jgi:hypothetical protein